MDNKTPPKKNNSSIRIMLRSKTWIISPIVSAIIGWYLGFKDCIDFSDTSIRMSIITSAGLLAGFLFASFSLITAMPAENAAIRAFKKSDVIDCLIKNLTAGIFTNIFVLVISITKVSAQVVVIAFFAGLGNIFVAGYFLFYIFSSISVVSRDKF